MLTRLDLSCVGANEDFLINILSATSNVNYLGYHRFFNLDLPEGEPLLGLAKLGQSLEQVRTKLTTLILSIAFYAQNWFLQSRDEKLKPLNPRSTWTNTPVGLAYGAPPQWLRNSFFPLHRFEKLKSLTIPFVMLFGYSPKSNSVQILDSLPPLLGRLVLTDGMGRFPNYE